MCVEEPSLDHLSCQLSPSLRGGSSQGGFAALHIFSCSVWHRFWLRGKPPLPKEDNIQPCYSSISADIVVMKINGISKADVTYL